jgi:hypothetical protein
MNTQTDILLPDTVSKVQLMKLSIREQVLEGELNPLEFYRRAKLIVECFEELKKDPDILELAHQERAKWGKEKPSINGSIVDTSSKTTYDYESTGDPVYQELKEKLKQREAFLKAIPSGGTVDPETGQLLMPPVTKISNFITVKI